MSMFDAYLSLVLYPINFILSVLLCILYVYLFKNDKKSKTHYIILISLILSMIYCILSYIFIDGNLIFSQHEKYPCLYANLIIGIIIFQRTIIYSFHAYKLNISFNDSIFEINKNVFPMVYGVLSIMCCTYFILVYIFRYTQPVFSCHENRYIGATIYVIIDIICGIISVRVFAVKIYKLLDIQMVPEMKFVAHKLTILAVINIISSFVFVLISILFHRYIKPYKLFCIDLLINNITLILSFGKATYLFRKFCSCFECNKSEDALIRIRSAATIEIPMSPAIISPTIASPTVGSPTVVSEQVSSTKCNNKIDSKANNKDKVTDSPVHIQLTPPTIQTRNFDFNTINSVNEANTTTVIIKQPVILPHKNVSNSLNLPNINQISYKKNSNSLQLPYKSYSSSLRLPYKKNSNSLNIPALSIQDSLSVSQQIITETINPNLGITMTTLIETNSIDFDSNGKRVRRDSIDNFVTTMVELQEPTGIEGNEVESKKLTPFDDTINNNNNDNNNNNIDWNDVQINVDDKDDTYEALKRKTPSTCVKQMKDLGIIM